MSQSHSSHRRRPGCPLGAACSAQIDLCEQPSPLFSFPRSARIELGGVHVVPAAQVSLPHSGPFLLRAPLLRLVLSPSLPRRQIQPAHSWRPSEDHFHGGGLAARLSREGRHSEDHQQLGRCGSHQKKDHEYYITKHH